ncbi:MAG: hypothetical protein RIF41_25235 [Polyangiaceae bacterium]
MENPGSTREVNALLGVDGSVANSLQPRGLPDDVDDETLAADPFFIDDAIAATDAGDCVDTRFCSSGQAQEWVASGRAKLLAAERVTSPESFGYSWATPDELERVLD